MKKELSENRTVVGESILVYDLEATCWEPKSSQPSDESSEIIAIGWCFLNTATWEPFDMGQLIVKPEKSKLSPFCIELTGITPKMIKGGMTFEALCKNLVHKRGFRKYLSASWGSDDRMVWNQCEQDNCEYPFSGKHIDIAAMYQVMLSRSRATGLAMALKELGLEFEGTPHRPEWDAWNTAKVLGIILSGKLHTKINAKASTG